MATRNTANLTEDDLMCPICLEEFNLQDEKRLPYMLACLHTFCKFCLIHVREHNGRLKCSICRAIHNIYEVEELMYNYDIVEYYRKKRISDGISENQMQMEWENFFFSRRPARWIWGLGKQLPHPSVFSGMGEEEDVFVGMATHRGGLIPGMIVPRKERCYIPWGGTTLEKRFYFILDNPGDFTFFWEPASDGNVPLNALKSGKVEDGSEETLYTARVSIEGSTFFGKVHPSHEVCYIPYKGIERAIKEYEVLCSSEHQTRCVNIFNPTLSRWVSGSDGVLPRNSIKGGVNSDGPLYVGMAKHEGGHIPGVIYPKENKCYIPWGTRSIEKADYYILVAPTADFLRWKWASLGEVPENALKAGRSESGEPLFIGRMELGPNLFICGKVHPSHNVCYIPYNGSERAFRRYEVLCASNNYQNNVKLP